MGRGLTAVGESAMGAIMDIDALPLEYKLEQMRTWRDLELPHGVDYAFVLGVGGILGSCLQEQPLHFVGVNACSVANDFSNALLVIEDAVKTLP
jgi:hypothetical protein